MIFQKLFQHPIWLKLIGDEKDFPVEGHRAFNAISVFTLIVLTALLPFNLFLQLYHMALLITLLIIFQVVLYYLSRFRGRMAIGMNIYASISYLTLIFTYFFNSGSNGPALYLFFLTLMLLVTFTPKRQHLVWLGLHTLTGSAMLYIEYFHPGIIHDPYTSPQHRFMDIVSTYIICLLLVLLLTKYLQNIYQREKEKAERITDALIAKNRELEDMHREKDRMFSIISHDLKKPLDSIISYMQMMEQYSFGEQERRGLEERLLTLSQHSSELLTNLLSWSRARMEGEHTRLAPVSVREVVEKEIEQQTVIADIKSIRLQQHVSPELYVMADINLLQLVMRNLVSNAIKFTRPGGLVEITAYLNNGNGYILVKDNGIGISTSVPDSQFQALQQNVRYGTANEKGTGVGLFLCKQCIELQHGRIWFESEVGVGTTFYVTLPTV